MKVKKISNKVNIDEQFDVELQDFLNGYWCNCDCGQKFPKKDKSQVAELHDLLGGTYVFKNPTATQIASAQEYCQEVGLTYCYVTGTKKTTSLW